MRAPLVAAFTPSVVEVLELPKPWPEALKSWGHLGVSENSGTPKSSILTGFSIIHHPFWGTPIFGNTHLKHVDICFFVVGGFNPSIRSISQVGSFLQGENNKSLKPPPSFGINLSNLSWEIVMELKDLFLATCWRLTYKRLLWMKKLVLDGSVGVTEFSWREDSVESGPLKN